MAAETGVSAGKPARLTGVSDDTGHARRGENVRELENVIQRAVILSQEGCLTLPPFRAECEPRPAHDEPKTLEGIERAAIARVLGETNGVIGGPRERPRGSASSERRCSL